MAGPRQQNRSRRSREESTESPNDRSSHRAVDGVAVVVLTAMVVALGCKEIGVGGFSWSDAPQHAMDGVMLYDLARAYPPEKDLESWASAYFARYPCLGLIVYYPPFHPIVELCAYALFGISEGVARGTVVAMAVVAVLALYWLGVGLYGRPAACLAAGLLATAPFGVTWLRDVMLEWPALAMAILAAGCYQAWYHRPSWRWAILGGLATTVAVLTKQTTVFLLLLFLAHLLSVSVVAAVRQNWPPGARNRRHENDLRMVMMVAAAAMIILVFLGLYDRVSSRYADLSRFLVSGRPPWAHLGTLENYTRYLGWFDRVFGWPFLVAWVLGLAIIVIRWEWRGGRFALLWLILLWVQHTLIAWKEPRYFFFALPAAALLAGRGWSLIGKVGRIPLGVIPLAGLIGYQLVAGMVEPARRLPDYGAAVQLLVDRGDADIVLMDGVREGQFVFDVRTHPQAAGRIITFRGSKMLYSRAARGRWRHQTHRGTPEAILELLDQYGIRYVVIESQWPGMSEEAAPDWRDAASRVLRELLTDETRFERIGCFPLKCEDPAWDRVALQVYRYRNAPPRKAKTVTIPIPALKKDVVVPLP